MDSVKIWDRYKSGTFSYLLSLTCTKRSSSKTSIFEKAKTEKVQNRSVADENAVDFAFSIFYTRQL